MKLYKSILATAALSATLFTGCADEFAETNTAKDAVKDANISYLFAEGVNVFEPCGYTYWFYNAPMMYSWNQMAVPTDGMTTAILATSNTGDQGSKYMETLRYLRDIDFEMEKAPDATKAFKAYREAVQVLTIYLGIFDSDMFGNLAYNEAGRYRYGGTLTPKFDSLDKLYDQWLQELDNAVEAFTAPGNVFSESQDVVFKGKLAKWAKFANSLKLKLAVRLLNVDKAKALQIAQEVASSEVGYIDSMDEAVLFNKATVSTKGDDLICHWSNGFMDGTAANANVINFMVNNLDPRVRFCYQKNSWNSEIVQAYYDRGQEIPAFIEENVEYAMVDGKKKFVAWKGAGEPWVRYYGFPTEYNSKTKAEYDWYYKYGDKKITGYYTDSEGKQQKAEKSYRPFSMFQQMMIIGRNYHASVPTTPEVVKSLPTNNRPWYGLYMGAAEVNFYLAEFKLLGASLAKTAEEYYNKALELSVKEYDKLAGLNQIAYYKNTYAYDPHEVSIELKDGEIETMMAMDAYKLTGDVASDLEKVYLQQILNFTLYPNDQFVTSRRSGYPKIGSSLLAREAYSDIPVNMVPRRFDTGMPVNTDLMYDNYMESYKAQGFTPTSNGSGHSNLLHDERIWFDKNAPEWGAGHNN